MKKAGFISRKLLIGVIGLIACLPIQMQAAPFVHQNSNRVTINFNRAWKYNATDNATFSSTSYNDASWTAVCTPHANIIVKHAYYNGGTVGTGTGAEYMFTSWYRKHYTPPPAYNGRRFILEFEGVATIATVYVNGTQAGSHQGAYTGFSIDITGLVVTGQDNVVAVQVNSNRQALVPPEGGSMDFTVFGGIVRNVNLIVADPLHVEWNWVSIPKAASATAAPNGTVTSHVNVVNSAAASKTCTATTSIVDRTGNVVATGSGTATIAAGGTATINYATTSAVTGFWGPDNPCLYTVYTQLQDGSAYVDEHADVTGFRTVYVVSGSSSSGIYINGTKIKLFGLNRHETFPFFGRAAAARLQRKDADILKYELGCNLVRCSHYTQAPDFIKRCDEIGLMLIEEVPGWSYLGGTAWQSMLMTNLKEMIYRDRNRPSVISFGVRVNESGDNDAFYGPMNDTARAIDPTRPTHGVRRGGNSSFTSFLEDIYTRNFADATSTGPFPWFTTETVGHTITPQVHSWDNDVTQFTQIEAHMGEQHNSYGSNYIIGKLGWCAFDYQSPHSNATAAETGRGLNAYVSPHGVMSIFRIPKICAFFFQSQRDPALYGPMVHIANDWTPASPTLVTVFSNCSTVELFNNGTSLGTRTGTVGTYLPHPVFQWTGVTFGSGGTLRAVGYIGGVQAAADHVSTPGAPVRIVLTPDTTVINDGGDMTRIVVSLVDSSGRAIRSRADSITMSATGAGDFIGEARSALEGGQFAFYVKSRDGVFGTITGQAGVIGSSTITAGTTVITVVAAGTGTVGGDALYGGHGIFNGRKSTAVVCGSRFTVPAGVPENARVAVFDLSGRQLRSLPVIRGKTIDLGKIAGAADAVHVIKYSADKTNGGN